MSSWHRLVPSSGDDHSCTHAGCSVIVADEVVKLLAIDCPAPPCEESSDGVCVFVEAADGDGELYAECAYCSKRGDLVEEDVEEDLEDLDAGE